MFRPLGVELGRPTLDDARIAAHPWAATFGPSGEVSVRLCQTVPLWKLVGSGTLLMIESRSNTYQISRHWWLRFEHWQMQGIGIASIFNGGLTRIVWKIPP